MIPLSDARVHARHGHGEFRSPEIDPDYIIPGHCTGLNTIIAVHMAMPKKLVMPSTGTRVIFGA